MRRSRSQEKSFFLPPTEAEPLREPSQSPNLSRCAYHTFCFQLVTEGSEVITKPRWRALPCLRPNEALGRGGCPSPHVPAYLLWCFGARAQERRSPQIVFVLPTEKWPVGPHHSRLLLTWSHGVTLYALFLTKVSAGG